jgi:phosphotransferase system enzyme I (PtsI)
MTQNSTANEKSHLQNGAEGELTLSGRAVSRGVSVGTVLLLHGIKRQFYRRAIDGSGVEREVERFRESVESAKDQLSNISEGAYGGGEGQAKIFDTHKLFLEDKSLLSQIESMITEQRINAEWAVKVVTDKYVSRYKQLTDKHLQEKYIDLEDVAERLLSALGGGREQGYALGDNTIIVARELNPSTLIELSRKNPAAVVTENGGWTSHTFILARELDLPAVTGIKELLRSVETGDRMIVDGFSGHVILRPQEDTLDRFSSYKKPAEVSPGESSVDDDLETLDGHKVTIRANLDITRNYGAAKKLGAKGIGLYRSEFLFNQNRGFPSEEDQVEAYSKIALEANAHGIRIRTFDLSVDQISGGRRNKEKNPALGMRGIRLGMRYEDEFRCQIRALLRVSEGNRIGIVLPMVCDVGEIRWAKKIVEEVRSDLEREGVGFGSPEIGAMVEVPAAVLSIERILEETDFINIGTNDLVQYLLAVDRDNEEVADWFRTLHSSVIESLRIVLDAADRAGQPAIVCGEMAGSPLYVPILIALGARELSMNVNSIGRIRHLVSNIAREECVDVLADIAALDDGENKDEEVHRIYHRKWAHLVDFENLLSFRRR